MAKFICVTCGTQFLETAIPPANCPICQDERQYVNPKGQTWTTLDALKTKHHNLIEPLEKNLFRIVSEPPFAIRQQAYLLVSAQGNILWDCISLLDDHTIANIRALGGISAIAISHPHYYSTMLEWAHVFGAKLYLHEADKEHVMRPDPSIHYWQGESLKLQEGISLINAAGHFAGGSVLHWQAGQEGQGALLTGDIIQVVADTHWVSFMYSYPNNIPLSANKIRRIVASLEPYTFERIYGAFNKVVQKEAKEALKRSAERYIRAISD
jgi:hypothetical protein